MSKSESDKSDQANSHEDNGSERPEEAENVLRAEYDFTDAPLDLTGIDGIYEAIREVADTREGVIVECEDRVQDYKVYWNEKTDTVRIATLVMKASYEVPGEFTASQGDK